VLGRSPDRCSMQVARNPQLHAGRSGSNHSRRRILVSTCTSHRSAAVAESKVCGAVCRRPSGPSSWADAGQMAVCAPIRSDDDVFSSPSGHLRRSRHTVMVVIGSTRPVAIRQVSRPGPAEAFAGSSVDLVGDCLKLFGWEIA
jgi:hypothetical protein